jgi:hypothetical protein
MALAIIAPARAMFGAFSAPQRICSSATRSFDDAIARGGAERTGERLRAGRPQYHRRIS